MTEFLERQTREFVYFLADQRGTVANAERFAQECADAFDDMPPAVDGFDDVFTYITRRVDGELIVVIDEFSHLVAKMMSRSDCSSANASGRLRPSDAGYSRISSGGPRTSAGVGRTDARRSFFSQSLDSLTICEPRRRTGLTSICTILPIWRRSLGSRGDSW